MNEDVTFYITRHGETLFNLLEKSQGWCDTPLTQKGINVAELLAKGLRHIKFSAAYSSDSGRAIETAKIILSVNDFQPIKLQQDKRLREWSFGSLEAITNKDFTQILAQGLGSGVGMRELNSQLASIPQIIVNADTTGWAEDFQQITNRIRSVLTDIAHDVLSKGGGNVLIVTHAFLIKTIVYCFAQERMYEIEKINNGSITNIIFHDGLFKITSVNDTHYFEQGDLTSCPSK
ncbi:histidine phosphatase family protein [[Clostridium] symbiosum]|uniref:histidine phosphatase family protein n=1 Tax=Clostridium symbiosum TaxID=1512 RepID=UPI001C0158F8|nr:histidine phosphatase family protein [[Clostridium] symbiosum]MBT9786768.1 histidine phosphatase family protein [[Clostridium] symbiosum]